MVIYDFILRLIWILTTSCRKEASDAVGGDTLSTRLIEMDVQIPHDYMHLANTESAYVRNIQEYNDIQALRNTLDFYRDVLEITEFQTGHAVGDQLSNACRTRRMGNVQLPSVDQLAQEIASKLDQQTEGTVGKFLVIEKKDGSYQFTNTYGKADSLSIPSDVLMVKDIDLRLMAHARRLLLEQVTISPFTQRWENAQTQEAKMLLHEARIGQQSDWEKIKGLVEVIQSDTQNKDIDVIGITERASWLESLKNLADQKISELSITPMEMQWQIECIRNISKDKASDDIAIAITEVSADMALELADLDTSDFYRIVNDQKSIEKAWSDYLMSDVRGSSDDTDQEVNDDIEKDTAIEPENFQNPQDAAYNIYYSLKELLDNPTGSEFKTKWKVFGFADTYDEVKSDLRPFLDPGDNKLSIYEKRQDIQNSWKALRDEILDAQSSLREEGPSPHQKDMSSFLIFAKQMTERHIIEYSPCDEEILWRTTAIDKQCSLAIHYALQLKNPDVQKDDASIGHVEFSHFKALETMSRLNANDRDYQDVERGVCIQSALDAISKAESEMDIDDATAKEKVAIAYNYLADSIGSYRAELEERLLILESGTSSEPLATSNFNKFSQEEIDRIKSVHKDVNKLEIMAAEKAAEYGKPCELQLCDLRPQISTSMTAPSNDTAVLGAFEYACKVFDQQNAQYGAFGDVSSPAVKAILEAIEQEKQQIKETALSWGSTRPMFDTALYEIAHSAREAYELGKWSGTGTIKSAITEGLVHPPTLDSFRYAMRNVQYENIDVVEQDRRRENIRLGEVLDKNVNEEHYENRTL